MEQPYQAVVNQCLMADGKIISRDVVCLASLFDPNLMAFS